MGVNPTAEEQLALQLINRARQDPEGEMALLFDIGDPDIDSAVDFFNTSETVALAQVAGRAGVAPVAWNPNLARSADRHNELMIRFEMQSHNLPGELSLGERLQFSGYNVAAGAESVYAFADSVLYGHAGFYIDWGNGPNGIQDPAGHREAMLSDSFTEVGIAYEAYNGQEIGPNVTTQHFGRPQTPFGQALDPKLLGVAISDDDGDLFYDIGEGLSDITVTATGWGRIYSTTTWDSGGYQMSVDPNITYKVTFSGVSLSEDLSYYVHVTSRNVARDAIASISYTEPNSPTAQDDTGDDLVIAGAGDDLVEGQAGNDVLHGEDGHDVLNGGTGDDLLFAGVGRDFLDGGQGLDWAYFDASISEFVFDEENLNFTITKEFSSEPDINRIFNVEFFRFDDFFVSATQLEEVLSSASNGRVSETDVVNVVVGTSASNTLNGTNSDDEISSGAGSFDEMFGNFGADTFVFGQETSNGDVERDVIFDFTLGRDSIDLRGVEVENVFQTSQGVVLVLEGDGDVIYVQNFGLDLQEVDDIFINLG